MHQMHQTTASVSTFISVSDTRTTDATPGTEHDGDMSMGCGWMAGGAMVLSCA
jgi:hypothetical protein